MKLSGSYTFSAPREDVWELLNDPPTLQRIIPGCERLEQIGDDTYTVDVRLGLAGVRGDYSGTVKITDRQPPERYHLQGDGRGKPGFAKGAGNVELIAEPDGTTTMRYTGEAQVGGPVAGIGQRLIEGAAKSIINQSLKALSAELAARRAGGHGAVEQQPEAPADVNPPAEGVERIQTSGAGGSIPTPSQPAPASEDAHPPMARSAAGLTASDVMRGMAHDLLAEQPWIRWALPLVGGFALGVLVGTRLGHGNQ
ncbi:MAG: carbon monoxide dehydrogenase subunit G [Chloroflexota bacterium]|nr:carbon monoxide dehydrogenase subunit G [Chloroflexota bacterium]